jgi:hypothetical protein
MNITNNHNFNYNKKFKLEFEGSSSINEFYSQAGQDVFVLSVLNGKKNGKFLDIGSCWPKIINNTYLLESKFGWDGVLIELDENLANECKINRKSKVICGDATQVDYNHIFNELGEVDYMSLDIDGTPTLDVLKKLPLKEHKIKVITFEHDAYRVGDFVRSESRKLFTDLGYIRICGDVANENNIYEDWYVHPIVLEERDLEILKNNGSNWGDILFKD